jgi:hypothetical protein
MSKQPKITTDLRGDSVVDSAPQEALTSAKKIVTKVAEVVVKSYAGPLAPKSSLVDKLPGEEEKFEFLQHTVEADPFKAGRVMKDAALRRKEDQAAMSAGESRDDEPEAALSALEKMKIVGQALVAGTNAAPKAKPNASVTTNDTSTLNVVRGKTAQQDQAQLKALVSFSSLSH